MKMIYKKKKDFSECFRIQGYNTDENTSGYVCMSELIIMRLSDYTNMEKYVNAI